jgi:dTDP-4-dehydrorhamnose reductase
MKILLLGHTGQVGFELKRVFSPLGDILAPGRDMLDLLNDQAVEQYLHTHKPQLILNAAAYTAVDKAETEAESAFRLNSALPQQLAVYAHNSGAALIHYSSDYVYPGGGEQPFDEQAPTGPLSTYGKTKLQGDQGISTSGCRHWIFRVSWVYSARGQNFMKTMLSLGKDRTELNIVADQIGAPTPARLIAQVSLLAYVRDIPSGIYHLAPRGETSWHGFAKAIFSAYANMGHKLAIQAESVHPIPTADYPTPATRPLNSRLKLTKLETALGIQMPEWQTQLEQTLEEYSDMERA